MTRQAPPILPVFSILRVPVSFKPVCWPSGSVSSPAMPKVDRGAPRPRPDAIGSRRPGHSNAVGRSGGPAQQGARDPRHLLARILDTPHRARAVPRLPPEVLHRVIQSCGLEDCGELVALATPEQLSAVFDLDLWRGDRPGVDEQFDATRFGVWLEVLAESSASFAALKLAETDVALVIAALAHHVSVFDPPVVSPSSTVDGAEVVIGTALDNGRCCEVGGYMVVAKRTDSWDTIVAALIALDEEHHDRFHRVMRGCRSLSNSKPEVDGLHDLLTVSDQVSFDLWFFRVGLRELVNPLVGEPQQSRRIAGAHLQPPPTQHTHCTPSRLGRAPIFFLGLPAERRISAYSLRCAAWQLHVVHDRRHAGVVDEEFHGFDDAAPGFINRTALRVATTHASHRGHPPAGLVSLVGNAIGLHGFFNHSFPRQGSRSRSMRRSRPGPISSPACTETVVTH